MMLGLQVPRMGGAMKEAVIERVYLTPAARVEPGMALFEMRVDLSAVAAQNCNPVSWVRVVAHEAAWVRTVIVTPGEGAPVGALVALLSSLPDEPLGEVHSFARPFRTNVGVVPWPNS